MKAVASALAAAVLATAVAGCGAGAGPSAGSVTLQVTRNFGTDPVARIATPHAPGGATVVALLEDHLKVGTEYGGDFVESIDGYSGTAVHRDWFYYVDGIEAPKGAGATAVHAGDRIWWDLHDWQATDSIPAVVGSYPDPFTASPAARHATVLRCAPATAAACTAAARALARAGVLTTRRAITAASPSTTTAPTILVGTLSALARQPATSLLAAGPQASGVYVRVGGSGHTLELLDPAGRTLRTLAAGTGLVAATVVPGASQPTWLVTGTDAQGLAAAARALDPTRLHDCFALVLAGPHELGVPLDPAS